MTFPRSVGERAGYARWLAAKDCTDCWRAGRDHENGTDNEPWLAERRAEEAAAIRAFETEASVSDRDGSDRSVPWAAHVRSQLLAAHDRRVTGQHMSEADYEARFEARARTVTAASLWIDQRDTDPADVEELLVDVATDATARSQGNPY